MHHQYASIVTGRDGPLCRKNPNYGALHIKMHIDISVLVAYRYSGIEKLKVLVKGGDCSLHRCGTDEMALA